MLKTWKAASSVALIVCLGMSLAGCSRLSASSDTPPSGSEAVPDRREEALLNYVEEERATLPELMEQYPGLYAEIRVEGAVKESRGDRGIPAGTYSVIFFYYTYANAMDWSTTMTALDGQVPAIEEYCASSVFPAMRRAGVVWPASIVFSYGDGRSAFGSMWSHTCTQTV